MIDQHNRTEGTTMAMTDWSTWLYDRPDVTEMRTRYRGPSPQEHCARIADFLSAHREAWTQGALARDANGMACDTDDPQARRYCALGLIEKFVHDAPVAHRCARLLSRVITPVSARRARSPAAYNDSFGRGVDDIIAMFRCAAYLPTLPEDEALQCPMEDQPFPETTASTAALFIKEATLTMAFKQLEDAFKLMNAPVLKPGAAPEPVPNWNDMLLKGSCDEAPQEPLLNEPIAA